MSSEERQRMIEKVRKCLALSKSANENEAAAALRQAQKLMQAYAITETDVGLVEYVEGFVDHAYRWQMTRATKKNPERKSYVPRTLSIVSYLIGRAFTVKEVWSPSPTGRYRCFYYGRTANVSLACYAHRVVYKAAMSAWNAYRRQDPTAARRKGGRTSFFLGWCAAVREKVENLSPDKAEEAMIDKRMSKRFALDDLAGGKPPELKRHYGAANAGAEAGEAFDIHRPLSTDRLRLEKQS